MGDTSSRPVRRSMRGTPGPQMSTPSNPTIFLGGEGGGGAWAERGRSVGGARAERERSVGGKTSVACVCPNLHHHPYPHQKNPTPTTLHWPPSGLTCLPCAAREKASWQETVLFPTPPLPDSTNTICFTPDSLSATSATAEIKRWRREGGRREGGTEGDVFKKTLKKANECCLTQ